MGLHGRVDDRTFSSGAPRFGLEESFGNSLFFDVYLVYPPSYGPANKRVVASWLYGGVF